MRMNSFLQRAQTLGLASLLLATASLTQAQDPAPVTRPGTERRQYVAAGRATDAAIRTGATEQTEPGSAGRRAQGPGTQTR